jgi:hypothetical protein
MEPWMMEMLVKQTQAGVPVSQALDEIKQLAPTLNPAIPHEKKKHGLAKIGHGIEKTLRKPIKTIAKIGLPIVAGLLGAKGLGKMGSEEEPEEGSGNTGSPFSLPQDEEEFVQAFSPYADRESALDIFRKLYPKKERKESLLSQFMPEAPMRQYAGGGSVGHIKQSDSSGVADDITTRIPEGSYVWNTTDTSLLGDGSPDNGVKKIKQMESHFERSGIARSHQHNGRLMDVKLSNDEYVMEPKYVAALGQKFAGNPNKGAQVIDKARKNLRNQKGVQKILPPKAKDVKSYFRGGL